MSRVGNILIGFDLFASTVTGGIPGTTLSGRTGSHWLKGDVEGKIFCPIIDVFMWLCRQYPTPRGHCVHAIQGDKDRAKAVLADGA
jgi:hypothetical protein